MQELNHAPNRAPSGVIACKCGHTYLADHQDNETEHDKIHKDYTLGPKIPEIQVLPTIASKGDLRLVVVNDSVEEPIRRAAAQVAAVAQRCMPNYPIGYYGSESDEDCRLYALIEGTRTIGMAISSIDRHFWKMTWNSQGEPQLRSPIPISRSGPKIARVWVAESYRHRRLAKWLIEKVGNHLGLDVSNLGWEMPLTDSGGRFVQALCSDKFLGCGDVYSDQVYE